MTPPFVMFDARFPVAMRQKIFKQKFLGLLNSRVEYDISNEIFNASRPLLSV